MFRGVLALMTRMLREDSIRLSSHLGKLGLAFLTFLLLLVVGLGMNERSAAGLYFFTCIIYLDLAFLVILGVGIYSSAISEERDQGTLGLLKMTGVDRLAILLGKSTSSLITTLVFLLLQLPFLALGVTLGGVTLHQVWAAMFLLGAFAVFLANFGLLCSLICRTTFNASMLATFLVGTYLTIPSLVAIFAPLLLATFPNAPLTPWLKLFVSINGWVLSTNVVRELWFARGTGFDGNLWSLPVESNLIGGGACFLTAWSLFERLTRNTETFGTQRPGLLTMRIGLPGKPRDTRGSLRVWNNPFIWQQFQFGAGGTYRWWGRWVIPPLFAAVLVGSIFLIYYKYSVEYESSVPLGINEVMIGFWGTVFWCSLILFLANTVLASTRLLGEEYRNGTLSALVIAPRPLRGIVYSKANGECFGAIPYLLWMIVSGAIMIYLISDLRRTIEEMKHETARGYLLGLFVYILVLHSIAWYSVHVKRASIGFGFLTIYVGAAIFLIGIEMCCNYLRHFGIYMNSQDQSEFSVWFFLILVPMLVILFHQWTFRRVRGIASSS